MKTIKIDDNFLKILKDLRQERITQDNWGTRNPIYLVQKRYEEVVDEEFREVDVRRLYIFGYTEDYYPTLEDIKEGYFREFDLPEELIDDLEKQNSLDKIYDKLHEFNCNKNSDFNKTLSFEIINLAYNWKTIAYFLSLKEAKEYQQYQKHNLGVSRIYADYVGYSNRGLLAKLLDVLDNKDINIIEE